MRILRSCCAAIAVAALSFGATSAASAAGGPASTTAASAAHTASLPAHGSAATGTALTRAALADTAASTAVVTVPKTSGDWSRTYALSTDAVTGKAVAKPATGEGCHDWDLDLFDVCVEVFGSGLNVTEVQGWADTLDAGWVIVYDTDDTLNGLIPAAIDFVDYTFPAGGRDFPEDDSICAHSDYAGQTACLLIHS